MGTTVQFHVRDAESADEDLRTLLAFQEADGALLFTCNGRGTRLFGTPNHDAEVVGDLLADPPLAGFFADGELGAGRWPQLSAHLHRFAGVVLRTPTSARQAGCRRSLARNRTLTTVGRVAA